MDSFVAYLQATYVEFSNLGYQIHQSERSAVNYILENTNKPTLALIVLREITPIKVNYVIRQNYTALPNTNVVFNEDVIGLNTNYQQYFTSGFLTLQVVL